MKRIIEIKGKKYEWRPENVHPNLLMGIFIGGLLVAAASFWAFCSCTIAVLG